MEENEKAEAEDTSKIIKKIKQADAVGTMFDDDIKGTWFLFDDNNPNSAEICIRTLTLEEINEMRKTFTKHKVVYKKGGRYEFEDTDSDGQNEYVWKRCITAWKKVLDGSNKPIECTDEEKIRLMYKAPSFFRWVTRCLSKLEELNLEADEEETKN